GPTSPGSEIFACTFCAVGWPTLSTMSSTSRAESCVPMADRLQKRVISADDFRRILGHFATGVTVITVRDPDGRPTGLTASAFTSVSLDPPLILVCVDHKSQSYPSMIVSKTFAVNILSLEQEAISRRFATTKIEKKFH